jgi:hypothetical protein
MLSHNQTYTPVQGARWMAKQGLRITPLSGKIAVTKGWQDSATRDVESINDWAKNRSDYNYGCVFKKGEFWAVDEDIVGVIERFTAESSIVIDTLHIQSSTGRFHWYFKASPESDELLKNITQAQFKDGAASVRVQNEYCVAPFSVHPEKKTAYLPVDINAPIKPAPAEFIKWLLAQQVQPERAAKSAAQDEGPINDGQRDNVLTAIAGKWRQDGLEYEEIYHALSRVNQERCKPPKPEEDVVRIAKSVCRYPKGNAGPTVLIGGRLPGQAVVQPKQTQEEVEVVPDSVLNNPKPVSKSLAQYPLWAWNGTLYEEFAELCGKGNHIPHEFAIESIKTVIGAICGHRIQPHGFNDQQPSRFYTILVGPGGGGKSSATKWALNLFLGTGLIYELAQSGAYVNIGCAKGSFASASGMQKNGFVKHSRILQVYDEITTVIEKFSITGSGGSFLDMNNEMFEYCPTAPRAITKDSKEEVLSRVGEVHNSILGCTTPLRWQNAFKKTNTDSSGFFQRLNIIANPNKERVAELLTPDLSVIRDRFVRKIQPLEYQKVVMHKNEEAVALFENWYKSKATEWEGLGLTEDITGRIQVLVQRNACHLAWLMSGEDVLPNPEKAKEPIEVLCDEDIMRRAIAIAEYEVKVRQLHKPIEADNPYALIENAIERFFAENEGQPVSRRKLYRHLNASRHGSQIFDKCVSNLIQEGLLKIGDREGPKRRGRISQVLIWIGEEGD